MKLFRSRFEKELDNILFEVQQYLENNYKNQADVTIDRLHSRATELHDSGLLSDKLYETYDKKYRLLAEMRKNEKSK